MPFISIITPFYNCSKTIKEFLNSVFRNTYKDFELILIDDGSEEDVQEFFKGYPVVFKKLSQRKGAYYARQQGVELARGQVLLFLDSDVTVQPDILSNIVAILNEHPEVSGLIGSYDDAPKATNAVSQFKFLYHHYIHQHEGDYVGSFWTGCGAIKRDVFKKLGGFDLGFFNNLNAVMDIDFGYRLKLGHYKIYNAKNIQVKHLKALTFKDWILTDILTRGLPWVKILVRYRDFDPTLNVNPTGIVNVMCVWLMLAASLLGTINKGFFLILPILFVIFLICNYGLLRFFSSRKDLWFMLITIPLLLIYYFNCGLCTILGLILYNRI